MQTKISTLGGVRFCADRSAEAAVKVLALADVGQCAVNVEF